jgi:hypothetical protein
MRKTNILLYMGKPVVVSDDSERLHEQAQREAAQHPDRDRPYGKLRWNESRTRLFRLDPSSGRDRFTGFEVREVVKA